MTDAVVQMRCAIEQMRYRYLGNRIDSEFATFTFLWDFFSLLCLISIVIFLKKKKEEKIKWIFFVLCFFSSRYIFLRKEIHLYLNSVQLSFQKVLFIENLFKKRLPLWLSSFQLEPVKDDWRKWKAFLCFLALECSGYDDWLIISKLWVQASQKSFLILNFLLPN